MGEPFGQGKVVLLRYEVLDEDGDVVDDTGDRPRPHLHGDGSLARGLERRLEGSETGETFDLTLPPEEAFGHRSARGPGPQPVPRATFPAGACLEPGVDFCGETPSGEPVRLYVTRVEHNLVYIDRDHPLSGRTLRYRGEVVAVRAAKHRERIGGARATDEPW